MRKPNTRGWKKKNKKEKWGAVKENDRSMSPSSSYSPPFLPLNLSQVPAYLSYLLFWTTKITMFGDFCFKQKPRNRIKTMPFRLIALGEKNGGEPHTWMKVYAFCFWALPPLTGAKRVRQGTQELCVTQHCT